MMRLICCQLILIGSLAAGSLLAADPASNNPASPTAAPAAPMASPSTNTSVTSNYVASMPDNLAKEPAPELGQLPVPGMKPKATPLSKSELMKKFQTDLELGRQQRGQKSTQLAAQTLAGLLTSDAPGEIKRQALFELALVAQDEGKLLRAEQIFSQYLQTYPEDPSAPEVILRQGLLYRQMGLNTLAVSKFYGVMYSALKLKLDNMDYYKKIVLQSQVEIADTYYLDGKYDEAADLFTRLLKAANPDLDQNQTQYKLVRSLSSSSNILETISQAQNYLNLYTNTAEIPEVRFFLAQSLKKLGRNNDAMKQVLLLLQSQEGNQNRNPEAWIYWQQRAGNEIASQLFKEGDYLNALQIYLSLAELDKSPAWQVPVWYQTALVYEQLQQWPRAGAMYAQIMDCRKKLTEANSTPALASILDMAKWRKDYIEWMQKARMSEQNYVLNQTNNSAKANP